MIFPHCTVRCGSCLASEPLHPIPAYLLHLAVIITSALLQCLEAIIIIIIIIIIMDGLQTREYCR